MNVRSERVSKNDVDVNIAYRANCYLTSRPRLCFTLRPIESCTLFSGRFGRSDKEVCLQSNQKSLLAGRA